MIQITRLSMPKSSAKRYKPKKIDTRITTTVVVIVVSIFFGLYLFALDFGIDSLVIWIMRKFGVGA